jgi:ABC-type branched-subunit amino acid transport system substrate-binding protein
MRRLRRPGVSVKVLLGLLLLAPTLLAGCGSGGTAPPGQEQETVTLLSLLPRNSSADRGDVRALQAGIEAALAERGFRAGAYRVDLVVGDSSDPSVGSESWQSCPDIGLRYAGDARIVGVVGPLTDACAAGVIPAFAQREVVVVSPTANAPVFTHVAPMLSGGSCWVTQRNRFSLFGCEPAGFYPRGVRTYAKVVASVDRQGPVAAATFAQLGVERVYVLAENGQDAWILAPFRRHARRLGVEIVGVGTPSVYRPSAAAIRRQARAVVASRADGLYLVGEEADAAGRDKGLAPFLTAIHRQGFSGSTVGSFWLTNGLLVRLAPEATEGMLYTSTRLPLAALPPAASALASRLELHGRYATSAVYGAEATNVLLDAIAASDGTRAGVRAALFRVRRDGLLGRYAIDGNGDPNPARVSLFEVRGGTLRYLRTLAVDAGSSGG